MKKYLCAEYFRYDRVKGKYIIFHLTEAMKLRASGEVPEPDFFGEYGKK